MHLLKIACIHICILPKNKINCHAFNMHFHLEKRSNFIHAYHHAQFLQRIIFSNDLLVSEKDKVSAVSNNLWPSRLWKGQGPSSFKYFTTLSSRKRTRSQQFKIIQDPLVFQKDKVSTNSIIQDPLVFEKDKVLAISNNSRPSRYKVSNEDTVIISIQDPGLMLLGGPQVQRQPYL